MYGRRGRGCCRGWVRHDGDVSAWLGFPEIMMATRGNARGQATIRSWTLLTGPKCYELRKSCSLNVFFPLMSIYLASQLPSAGPHRNSMDCTMMGGKPVHYFVEMNVDILFTTAESQIGAPVLAAYTGKVPAKSSASKFLCSNSFKPGYLEQTSQAHQRRCNRDRSRCGVPRITAYSLTTDIVSSQLQYTLSHGTILLTIQVDVREASNS